MQSLKHIKAYLFLHGKDVSKKAVDKFLSILQSDIKSGKITKAKDKYHKEVDRIQRSLVGMSNVMLPAEVAKVEIEAPRKKHYEGIISCLGSIIPAMVSGAAGKVTEAIILNLFKAKTGLSGSDEFDNTIKPKDIKKGLIVYTGDSGTEAKIIEIKGNTVTLETLNDVVFEGETTEKGTQYDETKKSLLLNFIKWDGSVSGVENIDDKKNEIISFLENEFGGKVTAKKNVGSMKLFITFKRRTTPFFPFSTDKKIIYDFAGKLKAKFPYVVYIDFERIDVKLLGGVSGVEEGVDLFDDHENIPAKLQKVLDKHSKAFEDGNYDLLAKALKAVEKIGYTFEYYVDGSAYDLRKIGEKGKSESIAGIKTDITLKNLVVNGRGGFFLLEKKGKGFFKVSELKNGKVKSTLSIPENFNEQKIYKKANSEDLEDFNKTLDGIKADEKKLRKSVKAKGIRLTHGYKLAKRKKGKKKAVKNRKPKAVKPIKKVAAKKKSKTVKKPTEKVMRKAYVKKFGKEFDDENRKQPPLPIEIAHKVALLKTKKTKAPKSKVKASVAAAIADLLTLDKYKEYGAMFLGMFYSTFKNTNHVDRITGDMKEKMFEKYDFDLFESSEYKYFPNDVTLTSKGIELINSIEGRINTLKAKKSGTDLFPELGSTKGPKTISETVNKVLSEMKAERSGAKTVSSKKHNTHVLPIHRQVEVMPVQSVSTPVATQAQTSTVKTEGTMSGAEMGNMTFEKLNFNDYYKGIFGSPATNFDMCIDGSPGSGKTTFLLMFANYLADFHGPTLFVTTEEFGSATLIDKVNRFNIKSKNLYFAKKVPAFDELKKYKFVFIDSINHAKITIEQYQAMREKAAKTAFILVLQQTKNGSYKGSTDWPHEVEITMSLFKNEFDERNLKISKDRYTDPVPRIVKI